MQNRQWIQALLLGCRSDLPLGHLPDELQRRNPTVSALAIFAQLLGREGQAENLSKQFLRLFTGEQQIAAIDERE